MRVRARVPARANDVLSAACKNLGDFVISQATAFEELLGFAWRADKEAPSTFRTLKAAYVASLTTGVPLPVSDEHSDDTIYHCPATNYAFRFWHDVTHVRLNQGFDLDGELTVARAHLAVVKAAGWDEGSPEYELLRADTLGQTLCNETTGSFPPDQVCFARRAIATSVGRAIRAEKRLNEACPCSDESSVTLGPTVRQSARQEQHEPGRGQ